MVHLSPRNSIRRERQPAITTATALPSSVVLKLEFGIRCETGIAVSVVMAVVFVVVVVVDSIRFDVMLIVKVFLFLIGSEVHGGHDFSHGVHKGVGGGEVGREG